MVLTSCDFAGPDKLYLSRQHNLPLLFPQLLSLDTGSRFRFHGHNFGTCHEKAQLLLKSPLRKQRLCIFPELNLHAEK